MLKICKMTLTINKKNKKREWKNTPKSMNLLNVESQSHM